jgi:hypothetical protein
VGSDREFPKLLRGDHRGRIRQFSQMARLKVENVVKGVNRPEITAFAAFSGFPRPGCQNCRRASSLASLRGEMMAVKNCGLALA